MIDNNSATPPDPPSANSSPAPTPPPPASPERLPSAAADPWKERLKEKMRADRNRLRRNLAFVVVVATLLTAGALWWMYPGPGLPALFVVAFDGICPPGEEAQVRVQLAPIDVKLPFPKSLAGLSVVFADVARPGLPLTKTLTDKTGQALADVHFARAATARFQARFDGHRQVKPSMDQAVIFFVSRDTNLVVVEMEDLRARPLDLATEELNQILPHQRTRPVAAVTACREEANRLPGSQERSGPGVSAGTAWLGIKGPMVPPGPILGRPSYHDAKSAEDARRQIVGELTGRWQVAAVGRDRALADFYRHMNVSFREIGN